MMKVSKIMDSYNLPDAYNRVMNSIRDKKSKNVVIETLKGFGGNSCISNLMIGIQSRGYDAETAQLLVQSALTNGIIELNEEMRAIFPKNI